MANVDTNGRQWWDTKENDTVATSPELWRPLSDAIGGFDLDPAAGCEPTAIADNRYTPDDDGLTSPWYGSVWLNPPFSNKKDWYRRLVDQYNNGDVKRAVALAQVGTSTDWFQNWFSRGDYICFLDGRDFFLQDGSENFATMLAVWNPTDAVIDWMKSNGTVVEPVENNQSTLDL